MEPLENDIADAVFDVAHRWLLAELGNRNDLMWGVLWQELRAASAEAVRKHAEQRLACTSADTAASCWAKHRTQSAR